MKTYRKMPDFRAWRTRERSAGRTVGLVATMGALHDGHAFLLERARDDCDGVVLSIYVNPTQFNDKRDLETYPDTLERDLESAEESGVDAVILPGYADLYPDDFRFRITESELSRIMEGVHRPGHFDGVLTVVMKLLQLVEPERAYFGKKDYQQFELVRRMCAAFLMPVEIVACATIREADGLACSSRNVKLNADQREKAARFPLLLRESRSCDEARKRLEQAGFTVDYVEEHLGRRFGAVLLGHTRLIDNISLKRIRRDKPGLGGKVLTESGVAKHKERSRFE